MELGRGDAGATPQGGLLPDPKMSRRHASVSFDGQRFHVVDHGSHNGTFLDGVRVQQQAISATARVLRTGDSLFLFSPDIRALRSAGIAFAGHLILGPSLQSVLAEAGRAAQLGQTLYISGESGSGKEGVARAFHAASPLAAGPFVALNCATIAVGVAERLLFGAKRGAFSGAHADSEGLIQAADGGTLFLDEVAELDIAVQAKLLRVLETREVLPLGALRPRRVNLQLCSASHHDLRTAVSERRFREDLYFRISCPEVIVPPLRQRLEEVPWLIDSALKALGRDFLAHSSFVEACLLRHWPGNVRELLAEVRAAAQRALGSASHRVEGQHLAPRAGVPLQQAPEVAASCAMLWHPAIPKAGAVPDGQKIREMLKQSEGNISAAARALGLHRTQLTRLMSKLKIDAEGNSPGLDQNDEE